MKVYNGSKLFLNKHWHEYCFRIEILCGLRPMSRQPFSLTMCRLPTFQHSHPRSRHLPTPKSLCNINTQPGIYRAYNQQPVKLLLTSQ